LSISHERFESRWDESKELSAGGDVKIVVGKKEYSDERQRG